MAKILPQGRQLKLPCSAHFVLESYKRTLNGRRKILESAFATIFKLSEKRSPRDVCHESVRKKRRLNDNIKTPEPSLHVDMNRMNNKENHPVKAVDRISSCLEWCQCPGHSA